MIEAHKLVNGHTLSRADQPYFGALLDEVASGTGPITIIVGAGVSQDAGFASWSALVSSLTKKIKPARMQNMIMADTADLMRKADYIIQMAVLETGSGPNQLVRDALYRGMRETVPGPLADWIARLVVALGDRVRLMTTNFDNVLEVALERHLGVSPHSFSLDSIGDWRSEIAGHASSRSVLHLHGMLTRGSDDFLGPVVLSESHFLRHGRSVRDIIREQLQDRTVIFIGMSLTDPNLVGPLWDTRANREAGSSPDCYAFGVAPMRTTSESVAASIEYLLNKSKYLDSTLLCRPVFLKSFSQMAQAVIELLIAHSNPSTYFATASKNSLAYGNRWTRTIESCYRSIGAGLDSIPLGVDAEQLSGALARALNPSIPGSIAELLLGYGDEFEKEMLDIMSQWNLRSKEPEPERWGLFLWLRLPPRGGKKPTPYAINLVGSSAYLHHDAWTMRRVLSIAEDSSYPVVEAIYRGGAMQKNLPRLGEFTLWRGVLACPVRVERSVGSFSPTVDNLTIGAIALNSTHAITRPKDSRDVGPSIVTVLSAQALAELKLRLETVALQIVTAGPGLTLISSR